MQTCGGERARGTVLIESTDITREGKQSYNEGKQSYSEEKQS